MKPPKFPVPKRPDDVLYWFASAIAGAMVGGLVYSWLTRNDPL